jgi:hypothetical protein
MLQVWDLSDLVQEQVKYLLLQVPEQPPGKISFPSLDS